MTSKAVSRGVSYALPVILTLAVLGLRALLSPLLGPQAPLLLFTVPVVLSAWAGGLVPGLVAMALGAAAANALFLVPDGPVPMAGGGGGRGGVRIAGLGLYVGTSLLFCAILESARRGRSRMALTAAALRESREHLRAVLAARHRIEREREELLESERAARGEAERAARLKDEFVATLSHELRTPLNAMLGWAQILRRGSRGPDDIARGLDVIERNARSQAQMIEDLLDMSRIMSGKLRLEVQRVDLREVVEGALASCRPAAEARQIRLERWVDGEGVGVRGDPGRLQQVVWNLLSNAIKFTDSGGWVRVSLVRAGARAEIAVRDSGQGISPEFLPHVFDRFRQADASLTRKHGGLGLGLSIVKSLAEQHGGAVRAESDGEGKGATFTVELPLAAAGQDRAPLGPAELAAPALEAPRKLGGVRVLVVDDEVDARDLVKRVLEECDADVVTAGSAGEALDVLRSGRADVLISDIGMPEQDGYDLIRKLRSLDPAQGGQTPAAALTALARPEDRVRALRAGYQLHLAKPVNPAELITVVAALVDRNDEAA